MTKSWSERLGKWGVSRLSWGGDKKPKRKELDKESYEDNFLIEGKKQQKKR